jgi:hypothetical protein
MRIYLPFLFILLLHTLIVDSQEIFTPPVKVNQAFIKNEKLIYQIKYGFVVGGNTTLSLKDTVYNGNKVFHALAIGQTTGLANTIYGVEDIYESWFDKKTNLPLKSVRDIKEGKYKHFNEVTYNRKNNTVTSSLSGIHKVPEKILDLSSTFYYLRRVDFSKVNEGDTVFVNMYFSDEVFPFHLVFNGKETIRTKFGKISCFKLSPVVEVGRMFKAPNDLTIWLTDDDNCVPVMIRMDIRVVGAVYLKLIQYENTANPLKFLASRKHTDAKR